MHLPCVLAASATVKFNCYSNCPHGFLFELEVSNKTQIWTSTVPVICAFCSFELLCIVARPYYKPMHMLSRSWLRHKTRVPIRQR